MKPCRHIKSSFFFFPLILLVPMHSTPVPSLIPAHDSRLSPSPHVCAGEEVSGRMAETRRHVPRVCLSHGSPADVHAELAGAVDALQDRDLGSKRTRLLSPDQRHLPNCGLQRRSWSVISLFLSFSLSSLSSRRSSCRALTLHKHAASTSVVAVV